jgi:hypothetical protein
MKSIYFLALFCLFIMSCYLARAELDDLPQVVSYEGHDGGFIACYCDCPDDGVYQVSDNVWAVGLIRLEGEYLNSGVFNPASRYDKEYRNQFKAMCTFEFWSSCKHSDDGCWADGQTAGVSDSLDDNGDDDHEDDDDGGFDDNGDDDDDDDGGVDDNGDDHDDDDDDGGFDDTGDDDDDDNGDGDNLDDDDGDDQDDDDDDGGFDDNGNDDDDDYNDDHYN